MDFIEQLEYPLPILRAGLDQLTVETTLSGTTGSFTVENIGGGVLEGSVMSHNPCLRFNQERFKGNRLTLSYHIQPTGYRLGEVMRTSLVLMTNGGEKTVPVTVRILPPALLTEEGLELSCLKEFAAYAQQEGNRRKGAVLFASSAFLPWLMQLGFEQPDLYTFINQDDNKERALYNFLYANGLVGKPLLTCQNPRIIIEVLPNVLEMLTGRVEIVKSGWGFVAEELVMPSETECPWLDVAPKKLTMADFDGIDSALLTYRINTGRLSGGIQTACVKLGDVSLRFEVRRQKAFHCSLSQPFFGFDDTGLLCFENRLGKPVNVVVSASENFIKLQQERFAVKEQTKIPVSFRLPALLSAQRAMKRLPPLTGLIHVKAVRGDFIYEKTLKVTVGDRL